MYVLGDKVRNQRKKKKISQHDLANGICTQATVSNIESKNQCDSLIIFSALCRRLDLNVDDCIELTEEQKLDQFLDRIEEKCKLFQHKTAYKELLDYDFKGVHDNQILLSRYNYYLGLTALMGEKNFTDAQFYLHKSLDYQANNNIYNILSVNSLGILYELKKELDRAKFYYDKSITMIDSYRGDLPEVAYKIFYNSAKFYCLIKNHKKGIELCNLGINLNRKNKTFYYIDVLYYELAFNKYKHKENSIGDFNSAYYFAYFLNNKELLKYILKDVKEFNIPLTTY